MGRGESWAFERLASETRVYLGEELLLWEPLVLQGDDDDEAASSSAASSPSLSLAARMGPYECFCLVVLVGPRLTEVVQQIADTQGRPTFLSLNKGGGMAAAQQQQQRQKQGAAGEPPACVSSLCRLLEGSQGGVGPGLVLKIAGKATENVRELLRSLLEPLESVVGSKPYSGM
jgi:urease accessory protein UreH